MHDWIDRDAQLAALLAESPQAPCLDTEFMRTDTFAPKLALIQLGIAGRIALIDPVAHIDLAPLAEMLGDPARTCVMHSASEDLEALATILPRGLGRLFDTQIAAAFAGLGAGLGYQRLVREITGVELPKSETRSDWLQRPLTALQLDYAAQDVIHLDALREVLQNRLRQRGYADWFAEDCARLVERARHREADPEPQVAFRGAASWPRERQAVLRRVALWREAAARSLDRPRAWLLDDTRILDLVARPPADAEDLFARTRGLRALRGAQRAELLDLLRRPVQPGELDFAPIPAPSSPQQRRLLGNLKHAANAIAARLDLPEGLLCARRHLDALVTTGAWPAALEGWRKPLLHDALMERIHA
jgi:ribonuclease D